MFINLRFLTSFISLTRTIIEQFILDLSKKVAQTFPMTQTDKTEKSELPPDFVVIGAGLAGSEAALRLADEGALVHLFEQKPQKFSSVHRLPYAAELVCSNSFKSLDIHSAHGLLKEELRYLGSPLLALAMKTRVPGGKALVVDREKLAEDATTALKKHPLINWRTEEITSLDHLGQWNCPTLIATGPLTSDALMDSIRQKLGDRGLYFYDATSPVVTLDSLDLEKFFWASRNQDGDDYLNLPLSKEDYTQFRDQVLAAEKVEAHHAEEELKFFEGCLPIEELARRGADTLAFSCMKPVGFEFQEGHRPYAVIQFRREKAAGDLLSMVGFQTRMKWPEQERVFRQLPGMANAQFARLGAMHRNSFINAPLHLDERLELKALPSIHMAGQITGSEGYTEALASGHYAALQMLKYPRLPENTAMRSLIRYLIQSDPRYFQPMNFNFGLLPPLPTESSKIKKRNKRDRQSMASERALSDLKQWIQNQTTVFYDGVKSSFINEPSFEASAPTAIEPHTLISNG